MVLLLFNHHASLLSRRIALRLEWFLSHLTFHQRPLQNQLLVSMLSATETSHFVLFLRKANGLPRIALPSPYLAPDLKASSSGQRFLLLPRLADCGSSPATGCWSPEEKEVYVNSPNQQGGPKGAGPIALPSNG